MSILTRGTSGLQARNFYETLHNDRFDSEN